jgi:hypothetical protein
MREITHFCCFQSSDLGQCLTYDLLSLSRSIALAKKRLPCRWFTRWASRLHHTNTQRMFLFANRNAYVHAFRTAFENSQFLRVFRNVLPCFITQCSWFVPPRSACRRRVCSVEDGPGTGRNYLQWYSARIHRDNLRVEINFRYSEI